MRCVIFVLILSLTSSAMSQALACVNTVIRAGNDRWSIEDSLASLQDEDSPAAAHLVMIVEEQVDRDPALALRMLDQSTLVSLRHVRTYLDVLQPQALAWLRPDPQLQTTRPELQFQFVRLVATVLLRVAHTNAGQALAMLRTLPKEMQQHPRTQAVMAEALALLGHEAQARKVLERLAAQDLLPSWFARRLLEYLRS